MGCAPWAGGVSVIAGRPEPCDSGLVCTDQTISVRVPKSPSKVGPRHRLREEGRAAASAPAHRGGALPIAPRPPLLAAAHRRGRTAREIRRKTPRGGLCGISGPPAPPTPWPWSCWTKTGSESGPAATGTMAWMTENVRRAPAAVRYTRNPAESLVDRTCRTRRRGRGPAAPMWSFHG